MQSPPQTPSYATILLGMVPVAAVFLIGVFTTVKAIQKSSDTEEAQGTVVAFEQSTMSRGGSVSTPVVEYQVAGQTYRCIGEMATSPRIYTAGDTVTVRFKSHDPGVGFIDGFMDRWFGPLLFTVVGSPLLAFEVVMLIRKVKGQRAAAHAA
jgi:hypothetical protein